ncbi:MAG: DUF2059 domain-containing protein [Acidobacteria bacterium]|nr:DUF2059 domain-containing protein [Acidobacteriota bacterium]MBS1864463.1 DUF2059 domain-containing protein [Acidobacteriota bacterium]
MKAVFALIIIYVGTFLVAIQGASNVPVQAAQQEAVAAAKSPPAKAVDPQKDADIRSLLELVGARDMIQEAAANSTEQYRQRLISLAPNDDKAQEAINSYLSVFQRKFDADSLADQLVSIYDKHYSEDEIKGLLQFYGSPLGQKVAGEMPKISKEIQLANRTLTNQAAKEAWQEFHAQNSDANGKQRSFSARRRWQQGQQSNSNQQSAQADSQQP